MKKIFSSFFLAIIFSILPFFMALAQTNPHNSPSSPEFDKGWFSFGLGPDFFMTANNEHWIGGSLSANFGRERFWQFGINVNGPILGSEFLNSIQIGRGFSSVGRWARISAAGGPAFVSGELENNSRTSHNTFKTVGIYMDSQLILTPVKELGVGIQWYGNVNLQQPITGFRLILSFEGHK